MDENRSAGVLGMGLGGLGRPQNNFRQFSPYLPDIGDPSLLQPQAPEFIVNQETEMGLFEKSFTAIGGSLMISGTIGSVSGFFGQVRSIAMNSGLTAIFHHRPTRIELLNHTLKSGKMMIHAAGPITFMYCGTLTATSKISEAYGYDLNDNITSGFSGALAGALYKSSAGLTHSAIGGGIGLLIGIALASSRKNKLVSHYV